MDVAGGDGGEGVRSLFEVKTGRNGDSQRLFCKLSRRRIIGEDNRKFFQNGKNISVSKFKEHDKNFEIYSASAKNIKEMLKESKLFFERELNCEQIALKKMSKEVFDVEIKYFEVSPKLHGRYDNDENIIYINGDAET